MKGVCTLPPPAVGLCPAISETRLQFSLPYCGRSTCQHRYALTAGVEGRCVSTPWKQTSPSPPKTKALARAAVDHAGCGSRQLEAGYAQAKLPYRITASAAAKRREGELCSDAACRQTPPLSGWGWPRSTQILQTSEWLPLRSRLLARRGLLDSGRSIDSPPPFPHEDARALPDPHQ